MSAGETAETWNSTDVGPDGTMEMWQWPPLATGSSTKRPRRAIDLRSSSRGIFWTARARCRVMLLTNPCSLWRVKTTLLPAHFTENATPQVDLQKASRILTRYQCGAYELSFACPVIFETNWILRCASLCHHIAFISSRHFGYPSSHPTCWNSSQLLSPPMTRRDC